MSIRLATARTYARWSSLRLQEIALPGDNRTRAAAACFAIAQDHHEAVAALLSAHLHASAFALVRIGIEAYIRGQWVRLCASNKQTITCVNARNFNWPKVRSMIDEIEASDNFDGDGLSTLHSHHWRALCSYTHTGNHQLQRWITSTAIEANYSEDEVEAVIAFADTFGSLAVLAVARMAGDDRIENEVFNAFKQRYA